MLFKESWQGDSTMFEKFQGRGGVIGVSAFLTSVSNLSGELLFYPQIL
jgi:hypothetical protein